MFDPLRPLKYLPWIQLLQVSLLAILVAIAVDVLLAMAISIPAILILTAKLLNSPLSPLVELGVAIGIGALGVAILERWFRQIAITNSTLWALIPCLALWLLLKSFLPITPILVPGLNLFVLTGIILGVFWKGRLYWR